MWIVLYIVLYLVIGSIIFIFLADLERAGIVKWIGIKDDIKFSCWIIELFWPAFFIVVVMRALGMLIMLPSKIVERRFNKDTIKRKS